MLSDNDDLDLQYGIVYEQIKEIIEEKEQMNHNFNRLIGKAQLLLKCVDKQIRIWINTRDQQNQVLFEKINELTRQLKTKK